MAERSIKARERRFVLLAIAIILAGVVVGILHRLDVVSVWVSLAGTLLMGFSLLYLAIMAARANRNDVDA
jgi:uncharacterized membrane protein